MSTTNPDRIREWWQGNSQYNVGIDLRKSALVVIDIDPRNDGDIAFDELVAEFGPLSPTFCVRTGGGGNHYYYRAPDDDFYEDWPKQKLSDGVELLTNGYTVAPPSQVEGNDYVVIGGSPERDAFGYVPYEWLRKARNKKLLKQAGDSWHPDSEDWVVESGERDNTLTAIAGWARRMGANQTEITAILTAFLDRFEDADQLGSNIARIARGMMNYAPDRIRFNDLRLTMKPRHKEPALSPNALLGPLGDWVRAIIPRSETHPAALIAQAICAFGNVIGARSHHDLAPGFTIGATHHTTALYVMLIGESAKSGKGDSWAHVRRLMSAVDPTWEQTSGVQTGEGLIDSLADDEPNDINLNATHGEQTDRTEGVWKGGQKDRRFFIYEPEFGRTLHTSGRIGSTLKDVYRDLWDTGSTRKVTAGSKQKVSDATVSLVGHITKPELERDFDPVDLMSGFGNRFLHVFTKRTRTLPDERPLSPKKLDRFARPLREAVDFAVNEAPDDYDFSDEAWDLWCDISEELQRPNPSPLIDALGARGRPLVRRMAVIYAVADCSPVIEVEHLEASWALWEYCHQTIEYIFGSLVGDRDADWLYRLLLEHRAGLSKTEIFQAKSGAWSKARLDRAMAILMERGLAQTRKQKGKSKPTEIFFANPETQ